MSTAATAPANGAATEAAQTALAPVPRNEALVVHDDGPLGHLFDTAKFEQLQRIAKMLAVGTLTPEHLKKGGQQEAIANCFRVANQALRWGFDPFAVAEETYVVQNKLGYQGKLVMAVVNSRAGLEGRLRFTFAGQGDQLTVTVHGKFQDEEEERTVTLSVKQAKTANKMWSNDPEQKLCYSGAIRWARRHCPEVIMGVLTEDDVDRVIEAKVVEPAPSSLDDLTDRLEQTGPKAKEAEPKAEEPAGEAAELTPGELPDDAPMPEAREPGDEARADEEFEQAAAKEGLFEKGQELPD